MNETAIWVALGAIFCACVIAAALIWMVRKQIIGLETVEHASDLLDSFDVTGDGFVALLYQYARMAVHAVEQLAKTGMIDKTPESKKAAAMEYVETFAKIDAVELGKADREAADALIEAAVAELPRNN